ncbi:dTDP-4-dehydrorhamnose reductase [Novosphingobium album (ex Liu et al. 2023)]|uniref:dTDP-4-dehydrorhamnose reductase n=1 Tax=Novosphingobium album (ex Liu et al. 2023) TaxID=3031130 RepID=A0ABT5WQG8_9SPHN|nr:dTDP-4-dehydrorhamnose reductase [Novosphingobium album (ex Liu et al. 2023)]MDE8652283.1 dTDP-4-dehydrorhamnose reductase [Novosphingobium album (ex Liu et al. 2023)]
MKVLIVGANGQLGKGLSRTAPDEASIVSHDIDTLDITDAEAITAVVSEVHPDIVFNAAAYTAVDKAESEEEAAFAVNATAVGYLAEAARGVGAQFVHVSTDFVFDGRSGVPYSPDAPTAPIGAYGRTKLAGEKAAGEDALIVRTAWVYAPTGGNFVRTMLRLMAERSEVRVVADQIGTPTYAPGLAAALWTMAAKGAKGIYHYTDAGACSWYDFAVAIQEEALAAGLLDRAVPVIPINAVEYSTPAERPHYSVLDKASTFAVLGGPTSHWRENLRKMMIEIKTHG